MDYRWETVDNPYDCDEQENLIINDNFILLRITRDVKGNIFQVFSSTLIKDIGEVLAADTWEEAKEECINLSISAAVDKKDFYQEIIAKLS